LLAGCADGGNPYAPLLPAADGDFFAGVGGTLIAAARHHRRAFLMELEPRYVDLICQRYRDHFGVDAVLDGDGGTFTEIAQD
jgi:hypothetical protein